jgi:hypothetical protein
MMKWHRNEKFWKNSKIIDVAVENRDKILIYTAVHKCDIYLNSRLSGRLVRKKITKLSKLLKLGFEGEDFEI